MRRMESLMVTVVMATLSTCAQIIKRPQRLSTFEVIVDGAPHEPVRKRLQRCPFSSVNLISSGAAQSGDCTNHKQ